MKKFLFKKIISVTLFTALICSMTTFLLPSMANATAVVDAGNIAQSTITATNTTSTNYSSMSLQLKAFVLDTVATNLAKQLIRQITADVVNWINNGFEGSPNFVTNPGGFLIDVADQATGAMLAQSGGPLNQLCNSFSIDLRLALSFKYHPKTLQRYSCTLSTIITNSKNAVAGASINGFTAGDFKQGGWPAFVSMTTEPQNNPMGAYLEADSELSLRVANLQIGKKEEIGNGKGFLSWRNKSCMENVKSHNEGVDEAYKAKIAKASSGTSDPVPYSPGGTAPAAGGNVAPPTLLKTEDCPIDTPGSLIVSNLETSVNGPLHELELVDSINQIVNALAAQLVTKVLQTGLRAVSGSSASDSTAYLNQIQKESNDAQVTTTKNDFIHNLGTYIDYASQYKSNKNQSLSYVLDVKSKFDNVNACYTAKIQTNSPALTPAQATEAQNKIEESNAIVAARISPIAAQLLNGVKEAEARYKTLSGLLVQATAAKTLNDLNAPSTQFSQMLRDQSLVSAKEIGDSQLELENTKNNVDPLKETARIRLQECQIFPYGYQATQ